MKIKMARKKDSFDFTKTKSYKSYVNRIKKLISNEKFLKDFKKVRGIKDVGKKEKAILKFTKKWQTYFHSTIFNKRILGDELINPKDFLVYAMPKRGTISIENRLPTPDEEMNLKFYKSNILETHNIYAYPYVIGISPMATKNEVIDLINELWPYIDMQRSIHFPKKINNRARKKESRNNFIYENYHKYSSSALAELVNEKFPEKNKVLIYSDIIKIASAERKARRSE